MFRVRRPAPCLVAALAVAAAALPAAPALAHDEGTAKPDLKATYLGWFDRAAGQIESLAEAMPADKYGWRPAEGVRSVSEVFMHVAAANYGIATRIGVAVPEGVDARNLESVTDKPTVVATLGRSLAHARSAVEAMKAEELGEAVDLFGNEATKADVALLFLGHLQEHLGQSIAYARMNGVVPPWSRPAPAAEGGGEGGEAEGGGAEGEGTGSGEAGGGAAEDDANGGGGAETAATPPTPASAATPGGWTTLPARPAGERWTGDPIDLSLRDADLVETIRSLARIGQINVVVQPGIAGKVTVELRDVPWDQALDVILRTHGLAAEGSGNAWLVARR